MKDIKILSWNVNGIRSIANKTLFPLIQNESPDILCLQEIKAQQEQLGDHLLNPEGYYTNWCSGSRKGYSGVATFTREKPIDVKYGIGQPDFDNEGRILITQYPEFTMMNIYFPNGKKDSIRLKYKMDFYEFFLKYANDLKKKGEKLIICGDFNTAHKEIDLARPKANEKISGFLPEERAWLDKFVSNGYVDTFRLFDRSPGQYSWWDMKTGARERNIGWRIDYFFTTQNLIPAVKSAFIMKEITGSDHCPVGIILSI
ncbi:MAG: exodeoxyribonuclease III [Chloroflexi bacterium]|nr:exodeoxyribonuclease III [Chloroflexota bacterium]